mgnify:CR=1 FL=1
MAWAGQHPLVDAVLPPAGPVTSSEPVLGGAEGLSPSAKVIWDLARAYLSQNPALSSAPMAGAAIGVPGGAARTIPRPQPIDLRKLANDYARFVMGKAPVAPKEPDPRIIQELTQLGQRTSLDPVGQVPMSQLPVHGTTRVFDPPVPLPGLRPSEYSDVMPMLSMRSLAWPPEGQRNSASFWEALYNLQQQGRWP